MADMLERIAKLLNQAENAGTQEEATVFMEKAQMLATTHSVDLAKARHATLAKERTIPVQRTIHIGERGTRGLRTLTDLCMNIGQANDLRFTIAHDATRVYAVGFAEDIDVTEAMFASLQVQQAKFLAEFKDAGEWRNEKVYVEGRYTGNGMYNYGSYKPQTWLTARLNFQEAFASRIGTRLYLAKQAEEDKLRKADEDASLRPHVEDGDLTEHFKQWFFDNHGLNLDEDDSTAQEMRHGLLGVQNTSAGVMLPDTADEWLAELLAEYVKACDEQADNSGTALVLVEKRAAIDEAYAPMRALARGSYRGGTSGARSSSGQSAGRSAADRASLGRGTAIGGTKGAISAR